MSRQLDPTEQAFEDFAEQVQSGKLANYELEISLNDGLSIILSHFDYEDMGDGPVDGGPVDGEESVADCVHRLINVALQREGHAEIQYGEA